MIMIYLVGNHGRRCRAVFPDVHIVFGDSAAGSLKTALRELGIDSYREKVITISDLLSIGPVWQLHEEIGVRNRREWLNTHLTHEPSTDFAAWYLSAFRDALHKISAIDDRCEIAIWSGDNAHDQTGVRFVLYLLRESGNRVVLANATQAYRQRYTRRASLHLGEIMHAQMIRLFQDGQLFQPLSDEDRVKLERQWLTLAASQDVLRIWQDGEIKSVSADYFDACLVQAAQMIHAEQETIEFIKAARLVGEVMGNVQQYVGDQFLEYRLRQLIQDGVFLMEGSLASMRTYSVKLNPSFLPAG
ncbi:DUF1835 domain-containing protein [Brevibacillus marinus]|uniref:DUF1835 domain-containing protein n=1 Tax=Brevibacillus marinus TaxID=2496837 RepID=UPI0013DFE2D8|nr:DUF1835 domain-containing protein [Brevibacillus marinus]